MTNDQTTDITRPSFPIAFFSALAAAMTEACGSPWMIAAVPDASPAAGESEPVRMKLTLEGSVRGEFLLEFDRAEAAMLSSKLLGQPADEFGAEQAEALLSLIETAQGVFCSTLEQDYGAFTIEATSVSEPPYDRTNVVQVTAADQDANRVSVSMYLDPVLTEALLLHEQAGSADATTGTEIKDAVEGAAPEQANLDLVMDVELNVTLRFGQRQLTLREVLDLTSGSVVELDRQVEEPVELLLNGMVIARGEAVVIDGNYGLRVTEVSQPVSTLTLH
jgi:flagellar motor switch protein FliN/FliY